MNRHFLFFLALASQVYGQALVDNFDPRIPRPGATLPASIDPYGISRPLPPSIDPLGFSYRPAHAGAVLPAMYDPLGASRPGGLPFALDPVGYSRTTDSTWGGRGYSAYGGSYGGGYDNFLARPSGFLTGISNSPIFTDPNSAVPLYTGRVQGTYPPPPTIAMPVMPVSTVPVAPVAPVAYPVATPVSAPVPTFATTNVAPPALSFGNSGTPIGGQLSFGNGVAPVGAPLSFGNGAAPIGGPLSFGNSATAPNVPIGGPLSYGNSGTAPSLPIGGPINFGNGGVTSGLPNLPGGNSGNLQLGPSGSGSASSNGNFLPPV